jgi:hypothetical protein
MSNAMTATWLNYHHHQQHHIFSGKKFSTIAIGGYRLL